MSTFLKKNFFWVLFLFIFLYTQGPALYRAIMISQKPAPKISLPDLNGKTVNIPDQQTSILVFWATWCGPCHAQITYLNKILDPSRDKVYLINIGEDLAAIETYLNESPTSFTILMDVDSSLSEKYGVQATPTSYIAEVGGSMKYFSVGVSVLLPYIYKILK